MAKDTIITLPEHQLGFLEAQVSQGLYGSVSEAVQAALRLLEEQDAQLEHLRQALADGEASGEPAPFDEAAFLARMRAEFARQP